MKIVRFSICDLIKYGVMADDNVVREVSGTPYEPFELLENTYNLGEVKLLSPCQPTKVICVGLNYSAHIEEFTRDRQGAPEEPVLFLKPPTAVIGPGAGIVYPGASSRVDYEAELAVVIGKKAFGLEPKDVNNFILGYTCANDVTARDLQRKDGQWTRGKGFDTFCPLGPWIETQLDTSNLRLQSHLNTIVKQDSQTSNMIFPVPQLISFISKVMTLLPGDVILTGTPEGVGAMNVGDTVEVVIQGIGCLQNPVI